MNNISLHVYFLGFISLALLSLAIWIFVRYQKTNSILYLCGFLLGLSLIAGISALVFLPLSTESITLLTRAGYLGGVLTFSMLLMFSWYFPTLSRSIPKRDHLFWIVPLSFFPPYILLNPSFLVSAEHTPTGTQETTGNGYWVFLTFVIVYFLPTLRNLFRKLPSVSGKEQRDLKLFTWALVVAAMLGVIFDVIIPATGRPRVPIGVYSSTLLLGIASYIVMKK